MNKRSENNIETYAERTERADKDFDSSFLLGEDIKVSSPMGKRIHPVTGEEGSTHKGIDIAVGGGTDIHAPADAVVVFSGTNSGGENAGYGHYVILAHEDNNGNVVYTQYGHLQEVPDIEQGDKISAGEIFAQTGNSGTGTGFHLHYEERQPEEAIEFNEVKSWETHKIKFLNESNYLDPAEDNFGFQSDYQERMELQNNGESGSSGGTTYPESGSSGDEQSEEGKTPQGTNEDDNNDRSASEEENDNSGDAGQGGSSDTSDSVQFNILDAVDLGKYTASVNENGDLVYSATLDVGIPSKFGADAEITVQLTADQYNQLKGAGAGVSVSKGLGLVSVSVSGGANCAIDDEYLHCSMQLGVEGSASFEIPGTTIGLETSSSVVECTLDMVDKIGNIVEGNFSNAEINSYCESIFDGIFNENGPLSPLEKQMVIDAVHDNPGIMHSHPDASAYDIFEQFIYTPYVEENILPHLPPGATEEMIQSATAIENVRPQISRDFLKEHPQYEHLAEEQETPADEDTDKSDENQQGEGSDQDNKDTGDTDSSEDGNDGSSDDQDSQQPPESTTYTIQPGDTLSKIAAEYPHLNYQDIADYNGIEDPDKIEAGAVINIPSEEQLAEFRSNEEQPPSQDGEPGDNQQPPYTPSPGQDTGSVDTLPQPIDIDPDLPELDSYAIGGLLEMPPVPLAPEVNFSPDLSFGNMLGDIDLSAQQLVDMLPEDIGMEMLNLGKLSLSELNLDLSQLAIPGLDQINLSFEELEQLSLEQLSQQLEIGVEELQGQIAQYTDIDHIRTQLSDISAERLQQVMGDIGIESLDISQVVEDPQSFIQDQLTQQFNKVLERQLKIAA